MFICLGKRRKVAIFSCTVQFLPRRTKFPHLLPFLFQPRGKEEVRAAKLLVMNQGTRMCYIEICASYVRRNLHDKMTFLFHRIVYALCSIETYCICSTTQSRKSSLPFKLKHSYCRLFTHLFFFKLRVFILHQCSRFLPQCCCFFFTEDKNFISFVVKQTTVNNFELFMLNMFFYNFRKCLFYICYHMFLKCLFCWCEEV